MPAAPDDAPFGPDELREIFDFETVNGVLLAVSGGSDSMALLHLFQRHVDRLDDDDKPGPVVVATVDHGLRPESAKEARFVANAAQALGFEHVTLPWEGTKPTTGLQEAAREARYALMFAEAQRRSIRIVLTAHTLDDQAETVLMRLARGSGLKGLAGMRRLSIHGPISLIRPLLGVPRERLRAMLIRDDLAWVEDPSNADMRFLRPRLREIMQQLATEGLDAARFANIAHRMRRADEAISHATQLTFAAAVAGINASTAGDPPQPGERRSRVNIDRRVFVDLPLEVAMRVLHTALAEVGTARRAPSDAQIEDLANAIKISPDPKRRLRRTLHGAIISVGSRWVRISPAPPRKSRKPE